MHRETAPLKQARDAVLVDTSHMTIQEVVERIVAPGPGTAVKAGGENGWKLL